MNNIISYAREEKRSWVEKPLTVVDSLILSQIAYINFGAAVADLSDDRVTANLSDFYENMPGWEKMFAHVLPTAAAKELLIAVTQNPRFQKIKLNYYVDELDKKIEKQFSAVSFLLDEQTTYVAFRGTDDSILAWKEDFNMAYLHVVPAQAEAANYLKRVMKKTTGKVFVGGHSKGGNLATYAAMMLSGAEKERVVTIFSHDGPGLNNNWWQSWKFLTIKEKINKTLPQSSPIGILLEKQKDYKIVKSSRHSVMQHDPFSWVVKNDDFVYVNKRAKSARYFDKSLAKWLDGLSKKKRELFVDTLYQVLTVAEITEVRQLQKMTPQKIAVLLSTFNNIDEETKKFLKQVLKNLVKIYFENLGKV